MSINKITIEGRLTRDPEIKFTPGGKRLCNFSIAVNYGIKVGENEWENKLAGFFDFVAWEEKAETVGAFKKGDPVYVEGWLKQENWEKDGTKHSRVIVQVREVRRAEWAKKTTAASGEVYVEVAPDVPPPKPKEEECPF